MTIYNPSREERAFLYQEAQDLEPLMKDLGSLTVMVEEVVPSDTVKKKNRYRVTFVVAPESVAMRVQATDTNLFEAAMAAKEEAARQLNAIVNSMPRQWNMDAANGGKLPPEALH
jgi:hypothetical protein